MMHISPAAITPALRRLVEDEIERLVAILDDLDGDPDAEPSLGWTERQGAGVSAAERQACNDREEDVGDEGEPDEDREPSLGWTEWTDQTLPYRLANGGVIDGEKWFVEAN